MRDDINLLNLMNGMHYSVHQLAHLGEFARQAEALRKAAASAEDREYLGKYRAALAEIVAAFERGAEPKKETVRSAMQMRPKLARKKDLNDEKMSKLVAAMKDVLFPAQREVIVGYSPCLIPPKDLKDPVRVGQANSTGPAVKALEGLRSIPEKRWSEKRDEIVDKALARIEEQSGRFPDAERAKKKEALGAILDRARAMDDVEFELEKESLAKQFEQFDRKEALKKELEAMAGPDLVLDQKIRAILLHPRSAALYEIRLKQTKAAQIGKSVDLDKISPADNCKSGGCAIREK